MAKNRQTILIYIVKEDMTAVKIEGDDAFVYERIIADALNLLKGQDPEKFTIFTQIKTGKVRLLLKKVSGPEFDRIKKDRQEDPK